jgi:hypothetical protein
MSKEPDDDGGDEGSKKGAVFVCVCARRNGQFKLRTQQSIVHAFPRTISTPPPPPFPRALASQEAQAYGYRIVAERLPQNQPRAELAA